MRKEFHHYLQKVAEEKGIKQRVVAKRTKSSPSPICYWFGGVHPPRIDKAKQLLEALRTNFKEYGEWLNER